VNKLAARAVRQVGRPLAINLDRGDDAAAFTTHRVHRHAVVTTGEFDLLEASPDTRRRQVALFGSLLAGLEGRFQLHVRSRADTEVVSRRPRIAGHLATAAGSAPVFTREVSLVLSEAPPPIARLAARWAPASAIAPGDATADGGLWAEAAACVRQLEVMGLAPRLLAGRDLDRFIDGRLPASLVRGVAPCWREHPRWLELDGRISRTFIVQTYPGFDLEPGWISQLLEAPCAYDLAIHGFRVPPGSAIRLLNRRIRDLQAARLSDLASQSVGDPLAEAGLPEAVGLRREIAANQQHVFSAAVYLTVEAADSAELLGATEVVVDRAARAMLKVLPATFQMAAGRVSTLPLGEDPVHEERLLPGAVMATLYPWLSDSLRQPDGHFIGRRQRGGAPLLLDSFDEGRFGNANIGVFGHSGAGKTFLVRGLLLSDADAGIGGFVIDPEAEYRDVCEAIGGEWVDLALGAGTSINVLDSALSTAGERDPLGDQVSDLLDLLGTMCGALSEDERVDLDLTLRDLLRVPGQTLGELRRSLLETGAAPRVARSLRRWTEGPMGDLFARSTNVAVDADFVVFSLRDLKEEVLPVAYFLIAQWIWARVRGAPRRRRLLFDEVGLVFEYPLVRRFLVRLARRVRKYQGSLCLVTQNAGDLLASDQGLVLATNPATLFLGAQRQAEATRLQRAFGLTDAQVEYLAAAQRGEFLLLAGERRHRLRVEANPWQLELAACARLPALEEGRR
jgi:hypothetical protein